ncbi:MAG: helix-turn-helix domain-containing protein, partial [Chlorobiales bacterium]|nr:helix-turn-helix domain-containing protein [Chlorobiales bacterium]
MTDKSTHFGKCLRHIRKSENLTLQSFAHKIGISKSFISEVERGEKEPGYKLIKSLKRKYPALNLNYLIAEESALQDIQRLEILEERVNHLLDIVQEKA